MKLAIKVLKGEIKYLQRWIEDEPEKEIREEYKRDIIKIRKAIKVLKEVKG